MQQIYLIEYVDAQCAYSISKQLSAGLNRHEAFGYITERGEDIIVSFAQDLTATIYMGLVIPRGMLVTQAPIAIPKVRKKLKVGASVLVTWLDVVFFSINAPRTTSTVVETRGRIRAIHTDHVVISDPETHIVKPGPRRPHPEKKPLLYRIPLGAITSVVNAKQS